MVLIQAFVSYTGYTILPFACREQGVSLDRDFLKLKSVKVGDKRSNFVMQTNFFQNNLIP